MKKRIGFVIEQALGHVAYGMGLREALSARADVECVWMEVPFGVGRFGRIPVLGRNWTLRGSMRARRASAAGDRQQAFERRITPEVGVFSAAHGGFPRAVARRKPASTTSGGRLGDRVIPAREAV